MTLHPVLRRVFEALQPGSHLSKKGFHTSTPKHTRIASSLDPLEADSRLDMRIRFDVLFSLLFLLALHGFSSFKILLIIYVNYLLATKLKQGLVPVATWLFNICILFANELGQGYPYVTIANAVLPWASAGEERSLGWGAYFDSYGGLIPRWEILFNVTVLRLISFNFDYIWARNRSGSNSPIEVGGYINYTKKVCADDHKKKQQDPGNLSERDRIDLPAKLEDYSFRNYLAYALYSPLYLAGPILTFNDYISQQRYISRSISAKRTVLYGIRFLLALFFMEIMIHFIYVVAISKAQPAWEVYTPSQLSMLGYFNLHHIWLKLLLPWRFFRLWALIDGIDPPENVVRCMSDNYSAFAFWRGWHRSFNRWIIRYIYIPLGGSGVASGKGHWGRVRAILNVLIVFSFVAMWHDIQLRLLVWGWLITLFILPEVMATFAFPQAKWRTRPETYRVICGIGAVGNILMMMAANLVGFAVGLDGLKGLVYGIVGSYHGMILGLDVCECAPMLITIPGLAFLAAACTALFTGVQVMFELRQQELRQGINMKC